MTRWKRLFYYLLINVLVSACTVWAVLSIWQMTHKDQGSPFNPFAISLSSPTVPPIFATLDASQAATTRGSSSTPLAGSPAPDTTPTIPVSGTISPPAIGSLVRITNVFGAGDLATERVRLEAAGQAGVSLAGWQLTDGGSHTFTFPELTLYPGGAVDIHTGPGSNDVVSLYWGLDAPVWSSGQTVNLLDSQGNIQATFVIP